MSVHSWCRFVKTGVSMCSIPQQNIAQTFVPASSACLVLLAWMVWKMRDKWPSAAVLWDAASMFYSKLQEESLCCSHLAFSTSAYLKYGWWIHILVLTQLQTGRNPFLFYQRDWIHILSISSAHLLNVYDVITFRLSDTINEVFELVDTFQNLAIKYGDGCLV